MLDLGGFKGNMVAFLNRFAGVMETLQGIATKESASEPLSAAESVFLRDVVEIQRTHAGLLLFNGWYPGIFYKPNEGN